MSTATEIAAYNALTGRIRVTARFVPQLWAGDQAITVNPPGPDEWDATEAFAALPDDYRAELLDLMDEVREWSIHIGEALDGHDALRSDPNAPEWVRQWPGPFDTYVRETEPEPDPNPDWDLSWL